MDLDDKIVYSNPVTDAVFPDLKKNGLNHLLFSEWKKIIATFRNEKKMGFAQEVKMGDSWFSLTVHKVPEIRNVCIYVTNIEQTKRTQATLQESQPAERFKLKPKGI